MAFKKMVFALLINFRLHINFTFIQSQIIIPHDF